MATDYTCAAGSEARPLGAKDGVSQGDLLTQMKRRTIKHRQIHNPTTSNLKAIVAAQAPPEHYIGSDNINRAIVDYRAEYLRFRIYPERSTGINFYRPAALKPVE